MKTLVLIVLASIFSVFLALAVVGESKFYESKSYFYGEAGLLKKLEKCNDIATYMGHGSSAGYSVAYQPDDNIHDIVMEYTSEFTISNTLKECMKEEIACDRKTFESLLSKENYYHKEHANSLSSGQIAEYKNLTRCRYNTIASDKYQKSHK